MIVITTLIPGDYDPPTDALELFRTFLDTHYRNKWRFQGRSIGIALNEVDLDLVITAMPSDSVKALMSSGVFFGTDDLEILSGQQPRLLAQLRELKLAQQQSQTLLIPDRDANAWEETDPVAQLLWTWDKNSKTNGHFVNVVKALKWWRRVHAPESKHPKSYPLEHLIGDCCCDGISSVAEGVTLTLENIVTEFASDVAMGRVPTCLRDRGVDQDVLKRVTAEEFSKFYDDAGAGAAIARAALDHEDSVESARLWRKLLGEEFPEPEKSDGGNDEGGNTQGGYTKRSAPTSVGGARFG